MDDTIVGQSSGGTPVRMFIERIDGIRSKRRDISYGIPNLQWIYTPKIGVPSMVRSVGIPHRFRPRVFLMKCSCGQKDPYNPAKLSEERACLDLNLVAEKAGGANRFPGVGRACHTFFRSRYVAQL